MKPDFQSVFSAVIFHSPLITWKASCSPPANTKPQQTGFLLTQLALGLIIILWKCGYFCNFHIPNYFCYSNISLALMSQILYLNSVRFLFFVPSEDCSCKIHGLRVSITRASRGWTYQAHSLLVFPSFFSPLVLFSLWGCLLGQSNIHVSYKNIGLVEMHLCLISMDLVTKGTEEKKNAHQNGLYIFMNYSNPRLENCKMTW